MEPDLWEGVASDPDYPTLFIHGAVVFGYKGTVYFVYNVLEIPCVPSM